MNCRHCRNPLEHVFLDLGFAPPSNAYLTADDLARSETYLPLKVMVCDRCWLVQTEDHVRANELFGPGYAYFSSTSTTYLAHAAAYAKSISQRLQLGSHSMVIEVASNDGYLLRNFVAAGVPCLGIEPTDSTAAAAEKLAIPVLREFFDEEVGARLAAEGRQADLLVGNNVFAHVPEINDFTRGLKAVLRPGGTLTLEFPHLLRLIEWSQFDTVYHEHFSYLSLWTVDRIFRTAGLKIWDVEELPIHGGSLRIYGCHEDDARAASQKVGELLEAEHERGLQDLATYCAFQGKADRIKNDLLSFLIEQKRAGKRVAAYGAAAKGNTLLNYAGIKPDLLPFVCDAAESKQGKYLPGSHIPIVPPSALLEKSPDYVLILPWNIASEVRQANARLIERGARFVTAIPRLEVS